MAHKAKHILYIEDSLENRLLVKRVLESRGFVVHEARNASEGIEMARTILPSLILMDINLPGLTGYEAATRLRGMEGFRDTPIVAVTARALEGDRERVVIAGCDGYIAKPIDVDAFPDQMTFYLDGGRDTISPGDEMTYLREYTHQLVARLESRDEGMLVDELTGVGNRRYGELRLEEELARCRRYDIRAALLVCEVQSFDELNQQYGHEAGNEVLRVLAGILAEGRRRFDVLVRLYQSRFLLFLYNVDDNESRTVAERLAEKVEAASFVSEHIRIRVSLALRGLMLEIGESYPTAGDLLDLADLDREGFIRKFASAAFIAEG